MQTVGITGGIGSGKSLVSKILAASGFPVFNSDDVAKQLSDSDPSIREELIGLFGEEVYTEEGLNRPFLAKEIFTNDKARSQVNGIIHPRVRRAFKQFCESSTSQIVFNEAAILIETGAYKNFDKLILVTAPELERLDRVVKRDNSNREEVLKRIEKQWKDDEKRPFADFEIVNDGKQPLLVQIENMLDYLTSSHGS